MRRLDINEYHHSDHVIAPARSGPHYSNAHGARAVGRAASRGNASLPWRSANGLESAQSLQWEHLTTPTSNQNLCVGRAGPSYQWQSTVRNGFRAIQILHGAPWLTRTKQQPANCGWKDAGWRGFKRLALGQLAYRLPTGNSKRKTPLPKR